MAIAGRNVPDTIQLRHWLCLVPDTRGAQRLLVRDLRTMAEYITAAADALQAEIEYEGVGHPILREVGRTIGRANRLLHTAT